MELFSGSYASQFVENLKRMKGVEQIRQLEFRTNTADSGAHTDGRNEFSNFNDYDLR